MLSQAFIGAANAKLQGIKYLVLKSKKYSGLTLYKDFPSSQALYCIWLFPPLLAKIRIRFVRERGACWEEVGLRQ